MTREPEPETECEPCDEEDGLRFEEWPESDSGLLADGERQEFGEHRRRGRGRPELVGRLMWEKRSAGRAVECRLLIVTAI